MIRILIEYDPAHGTFRIEGVPTDNVIAHGIIQLARSYIDSRIPWTKKEESPILIPQFGGIKPS